MSRLALIDGDVIRYQIGYATQRKIYKVNGQQFLSLKELHEYDPLIPVSCCEITIVKDIREAVFHTVEKFILNILERSKSDDCKIYLTGEGNYREQVATIRPYKGNRQSDKPLNYKLIEKYLLHKYDTEIINGAEADDALGWHQMKTGHGPSTCICTVDKDLNTIPGWHYGWKTDKLYKVTPEEAVRFFYTQLITGDSVDNIEGAPGLGEKSVKQILGTCETPQQMYKCVHQAYAMQLQKFVKKYKLSCSEESIMDAARRDMHENAHLLFIQHEEGVRWTAPVGSS